MTTEQLNRANELVRRIGILRRAMEDSPLVTELNDAVGLIFALDDVGLREFLSKYLDKYEKELSEL